MKIYYILFMTLLFTSSIQAVTDISKDVEKQIKSRMLELSKTMTKGGSGGKGYAQILMPNYTRWTVGSEIINNKSNWLKGINDWFDSGWRVSESKNVILEIRIIKDLVFTRRIVTETYVGPKNEKNIYKTGVIETWIKQNDNWFLLNASVTPTQLE